MKKQYAAPMLFVDKFVPDTSIAGSGGGGGPKNGNAGNNQNCWGYNCVAGAVENGEDACLGGAFGVGC